MNVTPEFVELSPPESWTTGGQTQDNAAQVSDMAQKATNIS